MRVIGFYNVTDDYGRFSRSTPSFIISVPETLSKKGDLGKARVAAVEAGFRDGKTGFYHVKEINIEQEALLVYDKEVELAKAIRRLTFLKSGKKNRIVWREGG